MGKIILVSGGARSGKSRFALDRANNSTFKHKKVFIATAVSLDNEMNDRILKHRNERGAEWETIEESVALEALIGRLEQNAVYCLDCLTVWLGNVWFTCNAREEELLQSCKLLIDALSRWQTAGVGELIIVTNEVGWGIVPESQEVRLYRDSAGTLNQMVGSVADEVHLVVCGVPLKLK